MGLASYLLVTTVVCILWVLSGAFTMGFVFAYRQGSVSPGEAKAHYVRDQAYAVFTLVFGPIGLLINFLRYGIKLFKYDWHVY